MKPVTSAVAFRTHPQRAFRRCPTGRAAGSYRAASVSLNVRSPKCFQSVRMCSTRSSSGPFAPAYTSSSARSTLSISTSAPVRDSRPASRSSQYCTLIAERYREPASTIAVRIRGVRSRYESGSASGTPTFRPGASPAFSAHSAQPAGVGLGGKLGASANDFADEAPLRRPPSEAGGGPAAATALASSLAASDSDSALRLVMLSFSRRGRRARASATDLAEYFKLNFAALSSSSRKQT